MTSEALRSILDQRLKQWLTRRKTGADRNTKTRISREGKDEIQNIFYSF